MTRSMTGYGSGTVDGGDASFSVDIRALNHRYLDIFLRMPRELQKFEDVLRAAIKKKVSRGRLEVTVTISSLPGDVYDIKVNYPLAIAYRDALIKMNDDLLIQDKLKLEHFIKLPDIFTVNNRLGAEEGVAGQLERAVNTALDELLLFRAGEGNNLKKDMVQRCDTVESFLGKIKETAPFVLENYRERLWDKLKELERGGTDRSRILTECAIFAERSDVSEEIVRLESHIKAVRDIFSQENNIGKKLDFTLQEMFREINTLGAKCNNYSLANLVVEIKNELEKMREQAQNIE